jgi:hypothetical protein
VTRRQLMWGGDERIIGDPEVRIVEFHWRKGGLDSVMIGDFVVENHNPFNVKDIEIRCNVSGQSDTVISRPSKIIYRRIQAHGSEWFDNESMGFISSQAATAGCHIGLVTAERGGGA